MIRSAGPVTSNLPAITFWGDSQVNTLESIAEGRNAPYQTLRTATQRMVVGKGVGGETAQSTNSRFQSAPELWHHTTLIWTGHNNFSDAANGYAQDGIDVKASIASIIASLPHSRYLVLSVIIGPDLVGIAGLPALTMRKQVNSDLAALYGSRFLDNSITFSTYDPSDSSAIANGWMTATLGQEASVHHLNATGTALLAGLIAKRLNNLGY